MDLVKRGPNDSKIENEYEWNERANIHTALENSTLVENRPSHNKFFEKEEQTTQGNLRCNLAIPVLKLSAVVTRGNLDGSNKPIAAEYTWATAEAAEWSKKKLHHEDIKIKGLLVPVKYASDPESYSVPRYYEYIPVQVKNAENDYKQKTRAKTAQNFGS